ncbi:hypothetical protein PsorP6_006107 [Peronosclerospora sorghi]|uniref:Uncharacterized protein n=1 Tax=Peronosclerospora sorghi TaxID=230839 RepID=A0ACC0W1T4_9STRA|nr:hypothetical protein PsorP6_006107 [Peronosclerospora sorghi]
MQPSSSRKVTTVRVSSRKQHSRTSVSLSFSMHEFVIRIRSTPGVIAELYTRVSLESAESP